MPESSRKPHRLRRWAIRVAGLVLVLMAVVVGVFYVLATSATSRWERLAADLRDKGEPLTYSEIRALRPPIPEGENGASAIYAAIERLEHIQQPDDSGVFILDGDCEMDSFKGISRSCLEPTREYIEARQGALDELSGLLKYTNVSLDVCYEGPMYSVTSRLIEQSSGLRRLSKLAAINCILGAIDGDVTAARGSIVADRAGGG